MVSDNRPRVRFRACPDVEEMTAERPLFQQNITEETCIKRQEKAYHKCHKCVHHEFARVKREILRIPVW